VRRPGSDSVCGTPHCRKERTSPRYRCRRRLTRVPGFPETRTGPRWSSLPMTSTMTSTMMMTSFRPAGTAGRRNWNRRPGLIPGGTQGPAILAPRGRHLLSRIRRASPTSLPVRLDLVRGSSERTLFPLRALLDPGLERDDPVNLLDHRRPVQNLIDRALLQRSHSQVNHDTAEDVLGNLLEDEITQFLPHHHDLEDARAAHVAGLEAGRATQAAMQLEAAMLVRIEFETEQDFVIGREGDPAIRANLADQAL